jgi:lysine-specific demethylase 8
MSMVASMVRRKALIRRFSRYAVFPTVPEVVHSSAVDCRELYAAQQPVILRGLAKDWPAVSNTARCWANITRLRDRVSTEKITVPVEIGSSYMDANLQRAHVSLADLLSHFAAEPEPSFARPRVYWAQHELSEVPVMHRDVIPPEMCEQTGRGGGVYRTNIWFCGPEGSVSPCHFDPYENLLCQVVGRKEVVLFSPAFGKQYLYPAVGTRQANTSTVDIGAPDLAAHPLYAQGLRVIEEQSGSGAPLLGAKGDLCPGDALFIPKKWWHYCRSPGLGCSVNFWWV